MTFEDAMRLAGLLPKEVVADGRWRRCPTTDKPKHSNGAYVLFDWGIGFYRNRATDGNENHKWEDGSKTNHAPSAAHLAQMKRRREQERLYRIQAMRSARAFWNASSPLSRPHKYIADKGLSPLGCAGLRTNDGLLVVPVWHGEWIISVQTITIDGVKRFWTGAPVKAGCFVLDRPRAAVTAIVEGLATGLAVFQSMRQARVIVAFDAGNLLHVVDRLRPSGSVVICGDNDHATQARRGMNPGIEKARNAAELIGCGVAFPTGIEGSDWADYLRESGEGAARRLERLVLAQARYCMAAAP